MTPLWGTKNPSAPVGDKSGGERRAGRAAAFQVFTKPEIRDPKHGLYAFHESQLPYPRFPTISHHFPRFPGISRPPHPLRRSSVHAQSAFLGQPPGTAAPARSLLSCALRSGMVRQWRGMGGMVPPEPLSAHHPHQQQGLSGFHETRDPRPETRLLSGARRKPARIPRFSRNTRHETRITAFFRNTAFFSHASAVG